MGISKEQKALVKWASGAMQQNIDELAVIYFSKIFELDPSIMERFSFLAIYSDPKEAVKHEKLKKHSAEVFKAVCDSVVQICDEGKVGPNLAARENVTKAHIKNNVRDIDFSKYEDAFVGTAKEALNEKYTDDMGKALAEAHGELIKQMKSHEEHRKLTRRMKEKINQLKLAAQTRDDE